MKKINLSKHEVLFWNIALPGFGQLLIGKTIRGIFFIFLEILINVQSNFNLAILYSFNGQIEQAIDITVFQWLMFYPCVYMFAMWDGFREADEVVQPYDYFPFVFGAFFLTIGLMYSTRLTIMGQLIGPVFFPMLCLIPGLLVGFIIKWILIRRVHNDTSTKEPI